MALPLSTVRQLALIRYMFHEGVEQSRRPSPLFVTALLAFHDAAELFLHLACEQHGVVHKEKGAFLDYFSELKQVGSLAHEPGMNRLNKARVNFKHHGNLPHAQDMEFFRVTVESFFEANTPTLFGTKFSDISLTDLVACLAVREHLAAAEAHWSSQRGEDARDSVAVAFDELLLDYRNRKRAPRSGRSPFYFGPSFAFLDGFHLRAEGPLRKFADAVAEGMDQMQWSMEILALGIDYRRYVRFEMLTPSVQRTASGAASISRFHRSPLSQEEYEYCLSFVIEAAVKLQEFDFTVPPAA